MEVEYLQCPMCGWCRPIRYGIKQKNAGKKRKVGFDIVEPGKVKVWQLRLLEGAGRGSSNAKIEITDYLILKNLDLKTKNKIKNQCKKILQELAK